MKIIVEFDSMDEFEAFRTSGRKTRGKSQSGMTEVEEAVEAQAGRADPTDTRPPPAAPPAPAAQGFTPPPTATVHSFPGNSGTNPIVTAIIAKIDGALSSGQPTDAVVMWFRQQIGPDAANATLEQIKTVFIPRLSEAQLKQIAPQLGIGI